MNNKFDLKQLRQLTEDCHEVTIMFFTEKGKPLDGSDSSGSPTLMAALLGRIESLRRELATVRHYMNDDNEAMVDEAMARGEFLDVESYDPVPKCEHEWVDATNEVIQDGEVCTKCYAVRATPPTPDAEEIELRRQQATPFSTLYVSEGTKRFLSEDLTPSKTSVDIGTAPSDRELGNRKLPPDAGADLVLKQGDGSDIHNLSSGSALIGLTKPTVLPDSLPNPVLLCECCAHRGKSWKFQERCPTCDGTGWPDKGVWAKANPDETNYAMDLSMWLDRYRYKASELAIRLAFHISFADGTRPFIDEAAVLIDAAMGADTKRVDLLEAFAGTSEDRGTRDKGLIMFPDGSIRGALPGDTVERIGQTVREAIDLCAHEPRPKERDYVEGRTSDG